MPLTTYIMTYNFYPAATALVYTKPTQVQLYTPSSSQYKGTPAYCWERMARVRQHEPVRMQAFSIMW